ncbi:exosome complex exonuclease DIS3/RRP44 [Malassezia restricta]|uniref:Ribosomal RNA-processing protein 44 n=1 Tax=Malassezia restricta (strain ATCC 96810 / NBRC 103918 / CBS 7877) TaxID=425264 RepID=A0A3G2S1Z6_MALR7|nr:exosome complex exonuclease DIS3/RRP44 [Malassezia restricta]AXA49156.1 exosome complex exonuclease DIS3/RRP44 [Malassezia restricta]AYO42073.1 Exosome complex exonuclease dis3 [Malassezia restricta CBS 7877]
MVIRVQKRASTAGEVAASTFKFHRKTARGKVRAVVRETYQRDDVPCGCIACEACASFVEHGTPPPILDQHGTQNTYTRKKHYVVVDTNVILHQMDVLESPVFTNVIIMQTVANEVRNHSMPLYNRLRTLLMDPDRRFWLFYNDFHQDTNVVRFADESPNDRNDRAIRQAAAYYTAHLRTHALPGHADTTVIVSEDVENVHKARVEGLEACSVREYITGFQNAEQLSDLLSARTVDENRAPRGSRVFDEYWPTTQLEAGYKAGTLHKGFFNANAYNFLEGAVRSEALSKPILLQGREAMNRAVDGDVVYVALLPQSEWKGASDAVLEAESAQRNDDARDSDNEDEDVGLEAQPESSGGDTQPTGRVVGIARRNWRSYVAHIDASSVNERALATLGPQTLFASPVDRKIPRIKIRTRQAQALLGCKILVTMDEWKSTSRYPEGHFVRSLGAIESKEAEQESLLLEFDVPYRPFSKSILACLPSEGDHWTVPPKGEQDARSLAIWRDRVDMRAENICSIDPPGCQDIDDALHAKRLPNGNIEAGVHIADVSFFVRPDTPMDAEAASRGTTVYLVDRRIDMLPHLLGTNLCSLRPFVERLAFSTVWELTPSAEVVNVRFFKSVIASKAAFTYEEAQNRKDDLSLNDAITESIRLLNDMAIKLRRGRMEAGALNLASPEVRIHLDSAESSAPIDVEQKEMRETNSLVEEFMLLANTSVARRIYEAYPTTGVLRRHAPPPADNFETLQDILKKRRGMDLDVSSSGALAASLDRCADTRDPAFNTLVRILATRCMLSAEYFCTGSVPRNSFGHYGLAMDMYTHFTSPIRRYADVLAHRQLAAAIQYEPLPSNLYSKHYVDQVLDNVNKRHRLAQMAGRASVEFFVGLAISAKNAEQGVDATKVGQERLLRADAYVVRTFRNGLAVFVNKYGLEGVITFPGECQFDPDEYQVTIPASLSQLGRDVTLGIFDRCTVEIGIEKDRNTKRGRTKMVLV